VMDRIGAYYAEHPEVVKVLGGTALAIPFEHDRSTTALIKRVRATS